VVCKEELNKYDLFWFTKAVQQFKTERIAERLIEQAEILKQRKVENKSVLDIGAGPLAAIAARGFTIAPSKI